MTPSNYPALLNKLKKFCSDRERCRRDVTLKIQRLRAEEFSEKLIEDLEKADFLNENRYIRLFIHSKIQSRRWGRIKVKANLMAKGFSSDKILKNFNLIEKEPYKGNLRNILTKKYESVKNAGKDNLFARLMRFGIGRGYEQELVMDIVNEKLK